MKIGAQSKITVPNVAAIVTGRVIAVTPDFTVAQVAEIMCRYRYSLIPVVSSEEGDRVLGFVSDKDCLDYMANRLFYDELRPDGISSIMKSETVSVRADMNVFDLEDMFSTRGIRHAAVVDEQGHLLGIVGRLDMLNAFEQLYGQVIVEKENRKKPVVLDLRMQAEILQR